MQAQTEHDMKMQGADSYLPAKERGLEQILPSSTLRRNQPCYHFYLGLPVSETEKTNFC